MLAPIDIGAAPLAILTIELGDPRVGDGNRQPLGSKELGVITATAAPLSTRATVLPQCSLNTWSTAVMLASANRRYPASSNSAPDAAEPAIWCGISIPSPGVRTLSSVYLGSSARTFTGSPNTWPMRCAVRPTARAVVARSPASSTRSCVFNQPANWLVCFPADGGKPRVVVALFVAGQTGVAVAQPLGLANEQQAAASAVSLGSGATGCG